MKETPYIPESKVNQIFGEQYISYCVWVPWIVLGIMLIATRLEGMEKMIAWIVVVLFLTMNMGYILYKIIRYILKNKQKEHQQ